MELEQGILLDKSAVVSICVGEDSYAKLLSSYLQSNPFNGIVTRRILSGVKRVIYDTRKFPISQRKHHLENLDKLLDVLKEERIDFSDYTSRMDDLAVFFGDVIREMAPLRYSYISKRFRKSMEDLRGISFAGKRDLKPDLEDKKILAEAICLRKKYDPLYLASYDLHFSGDPSSRLIENKFKIKCRFPRDLLPLIDS